MGPQPVKLYRVRSADSLKEVSIGDTIELLTWQYEDVRIKSVSHGILIGRARNSLQRSTCVRIYEKVNFIKRNFNDVQKSVLERTYTFTDHLITKEFVGGDRFESLEFLERQYDPEERGFEDDYFSRSTQRKGYVDPDKAIRAGLNQMREALRR